MYISFLFITYIMAMFVSLSCFAFAQLFLIKQEFRESRLLRAVRNFAAVICLIGILYFVFYCKQFILGDPRMNLLFRCMDYVLCSLLLFCWLMVLREMVEQKRKVLVAASILTSLRILVSLIAAIFLMDAYAVIENPLADKLWIGANLVFFLAAAVLLVRYCVWGVNESPYSLRRRYVMLCTLLIALFELNSFIFELSLGGLHSAIAMEEYRLTLWTMTPPDWVGVLIFVLGFATFFLVFREDFSPLFFAQEPDTAGSETEERIVDQIAAQHKLTVREQEVLTLLYENYTNAEIAEKLVISINTVKKHVHNTYEKLGINSRVEVVHLINAKKYPHG